MDELAPIPWFNPEAFSKIITPFQPIQVPGAGTGAGAGVIPDNFLGINGLSAVDGIKGIFGGVQALGNLWAAFQSAKLAKKSFNLSKDMANANLRNSTQSYNTALTDRITSRAHMQGMSADQARAYLNQHSLRQTKLG